ncbi:MAG: AIR carboxylase family protein, partial [Halobacteriaceae archaeon]
MTDLDSLVDDLRAEAQHDRPPEDTPEVGIVMGSDSDLDVMMGTDDSAGAYDALTELGFAELTNYDDPPDARFTFETYVVSAHRTPELMYAYGETAVERGLDVIIAGAGGKSADLPNMMASIAYPVPVIGV